MLRTHYDNLKVSRDAPVEVIHAAFRALAAKYHPDASPGNEKAAGIFRIISRSYDVLSDPVKRAEHDRWIAGMEVQPIQTQTTPDFREVEGKRFISKWVIAILALVVVAAVVALSIKSSSLKVPPVAATKAAPVGAGQPLEFKSSEVEVEAVTHKTAPVPTPKRQAVRSDIDEVIQSGRYSQLPPAEMVSLSTGSGPSHLSISNESIYTLTVTFYGTAKQSVEIEAGKSKEMDLTPGSYRMLCRANIPTVLPFVGTDDYLAGANYEWTLSVVHQIVP